MKEYGISFTRTGELWRGPYENIAEAKVWIRDWIEDGGRPETFKIVEREIGDWLEVQEEG